MNDEPVALDVKISGILEKFDGDDVAPENLRERIHIEDGMITRIEYFLDGQKIGEQTTEE